eukprot:c17269_g1_i1 orf=733-2382(+)
MRAMEPVSNQCSTTTPFPYYELHQVAHNTNEATAMDILCEIVNSEYSDIGFNMAPPVSVRTADRDHEKERLLDALYSSESKALEILDEDVEMLHEQHAPSDTYIIHFDANYPSANPVHHEFSSPDMHHFKLPLLEQEPETSINNSQLDEKFKHKEIRRNLERSILMHQGASVTNSLASSHAKQGERKHVEMHHEMSSCSNPMVTIYDECNEGNNKERRVRARGNVESNDDDKVKEENGMGKARLYGDEARLKRKTSTLKNVVGGSKKSSVARMKHVISAEGALDDDDAVDVKRGYERAKRSRVSSSLANDELRKERVEGSLANDGQKRVPVESLLVNDGLSASAEKATVGGPRMTHISVERNRRKQMNEHLAILRSLMPNSYVQRSDQASIIGGVVEFIKELQQLLASLETQKRRRAYVAEALSPRVSAGSAGPSPRGSLVSHPSPRGAAQELVATSRSPLADVEVKLAGGAHVLLRTLSHQATRGQLLHLIAALECMSLQILQLNITTLQQAVLYTFTLKIGIDCRLSVDDLADVGQQIFKDIHARKL